VPIVAAGRGQHHPARSARSLGLMRGVDKTSPAHAARGTRTWPRARDRSVASLFPAWAALAIAGRLGHHAFLICKAIEAEGELVFAKVSEMGLEGIVSKRAGSVYKSGRCRNWLKTRNPAFVR